MFSTDYNFADILSFIFDNLYVNASDIHKLLCLIILLAATSASVEKVFQL